MSWRAAVGGGAAPAPGASVPRPGAPDVAKWVASIAKDLQAHRGRSLIVAGEYQPAAVHQVARVMNEALGNVGATVTYAADVEANPIDRHASIAELAQAMDAGEVQMLVILGGNPVFTAPADLNFGEKLSKVGLVAYHGLYVDETAHLAHWNLPAAHALESWGDARAFDGTVTLMQPLIAPLYEGRSAHEMLALFTTQADRRGAAIVKDYWTRAYSSGAQWTIKYADGASFATADAFWKRALHDGFIPGTAVTEGGPATPFSAAAVSAPVPAAPATAGAGKPGRARADLPP